MSRKFQFGPWLAEYSPKDGGRLDRLCFDGYDLLTIQPVSFRPPSRDYGEYETRPVYGYDDCFPSVTDCQFPGTTWRVPDHGEVCWLSWKTSRAKSGLIFTVKSKFLPVQFSRKMLFSETTITWIFEISNHGEQSVPFQHVIHPLMPLDEITDFKIPAFQTVYNATSDQIMDLRRPEDVRQFLLQQPVGKTNMLFVQKVQSGKISLSFKKGIRLEMLYPVKDFPTIGIWWNNSAYPDEDGCRRNECAFEPISGLTSSLEQAFRDKHHLSVEPHQKYIWQMEWKIYA